MSVVPKNQKNPKNAHRSLTPTIDQTVLENADLFGEEWVEEWKDQYLNACKEASAGKPKPGSKTHRDSDVESRAAEKAAKKARKEDAKNNKKSSDHRCISCRMKMIP
eukprot:PhF_6_TR43944/c0_g2_i1/m.67206